MKREIGRKLLHLLFGVSIIILLIYNFITAKILFYILTFGIFLSLLSMKINIPIFSWFLRNFERTEKEKIPGKGILFFLAGSLLVLKLFPIDIALASISILTFADSLSFLFGRFLGKTRCGLNYLKNWEGIIFGILIGTIFSMFFVSFPEAFIASFFAMLVEAVEIKVSEENLDDNLLIPLVAGTAVYLFRIWILA